MLCTPGSSSRSLDKALRGQSSTTLDASGDFSRHMSAVSSSDPLLSISEKKGAMRTCFLNVVCTMAGMGILQLPYTIKQGGWAMLGVLVACAGCSCYTARLVITNLYLGDVRLSGYPESGQVAFGQAGFMAVHILQKFVVIGVATLMLILAAGTLHDTFEARLTAGQNLSLHQWTFIVSGVCAIPTIFFRNVDSLSFTSGLGGIITVLVVLGVVAISLAHYGDDDRGMGLTLNGTDTFEHKVVDLGNFPIAFSALCLSFGGHSCFPTLQQATMVKMGVSKTRFLRTLDYSFLALLAMYVPIASVGYLVYGDETQSPITKNLPQENILTTILQLAITINVMATYPILVHVVIDQVETSTKLINPRRRDSGLLMFSRDPELNMLHRIVIRTIIWAGTVLIAYYVPYFADMMSLIGALGIVFMVFVFPCMIAIKFLWEDKKEHREKYTNKDLLWVAWLCVIMIVGTIGGSIGIYQSVKKLADDFGA